MPLYEYECESCGERFEVIQKFSDPPANVCIKCGNGPVTRLPSSPAIQFKGSGWYVTDYAKKSTADAGKTNGEKSNKADKTEKADKSPKTESGSASGSGTSSSTPAPAAPSTTDKK